MQNYSYFRAVYTKYIVTPTLGVSGVGGAMAVYGAFDAMVSIYADTSSLHHYFQYSVYPLVSSMDIAFKIDILFHSNANAN